MAQKIGEIEEWKSLLEKLPGIMNVEIRMAPDGEFSEIHILASEEKSPKQIVRDVQSAMMAKYSIEIDHKIVSVAQIPSLQPKSGNNERIKYLELETVCTDAECKVKVTLEWRDVCYSGARTSNLSQTSRYRAAALATTDALNSILQKRASLHLEDVRITQLGADTVLLSCLILTVKSQNERLVGASIEKEDGGLSVVRATLDAVNRRLNLIL